METHKEKSFPTVNNFLINQTPLAPVTPSKPQFDLHWNNQGPPSQPPSEAVVAAAVKEDYPYLRAWEASRSTQWKNNMNLLASEEDPLNFLTSFTDLLAVNGGIGTSRNYMSFNGGSVFFNQSQSCRLEQQIGGIYGEEMKNCGSLHQYQSVCNSNTNAGISNFAPSTPESRWKIDSTGSDNTPLGTKNQTPIQQNEIKEQDVAAASINLQNVDETAPNTESSSPQKASVVEENEKASDQVIDENKTPQKKARRRRYQPKVLSEKKPRKTPKPKTPKPTETKETPRVRKKYVRKNKVESKTPSTPPKEANDEVGNTTPAETATKSCRRSINFNLNGQEAESNLANMSNGGADVEVQGKCDTERNQLDDTMKHRQGVEMVVEASKSGVAYDLNCALNQELEYYLSLHTDVDIFKRKDNISHDLSENNAEILSSSNAPHPAQSPNSSPCASSSEQKTGRGFKRSVPSIVDMDAGSMGTKHSTFWQPNHVFFGNANIEELQDFILPETCKKKRTEKVQRSHVSSICGGPPGYINPILGVPILPRVDPSASKYYCNPYPFGSKAVTNNLTNVFLKSLQNRSQLVNSWADLARLRKKRSKGTTRVRDPAKLMGLPSVFPAKRRPKGLRTKKIDIAEDANTEALVASGTANPISKKRSKKQNSEDKLGLVVFSGKSKRKRKGSIPALTWARSTSFIEAITERMKHLDISKDSCNTELKEKIQENLLQEQYALVPYHAHKQDQNALVVYGRDGTMVPFEGPFNPVKKRRPRAKVELDDETTKVWKLLLENIDNEGIDGTDEDKVKWWEKERSIFRGRVDSFIARMRLVQGDRRFSPWKGSVLDSVIGVFLTQNVSDHLSSSAFMSLAAHFPLKSEGNENPLSEESATNLVGEPDICVVEPDESISWNEKTTNQVILSNDPRSVHDVHYNDEKKVVISKGVTRGAPESVDPKDYYDESSQKTPSSIVSNANSPSSEIETAAILGDERARDEASSSQQSVVSSQSSTNSPNLCTVEKMSIFSKNDSRTQPLTTSSTSNYLDYSTSFLELLKMAESPFVHDSYNRTQQDPLGCMDHVTKDFIEAQGTGSRNYLLNLSDQFPHTKGFNMLEEDNRSPNTSTKNENSIPAEQSNLTTESTVLTHEKSSDNIPRSFTENMSACYVFEGEKKLKQSQSVKESSDIIFSSLKRQVSSASKSSKSPQANADVLESTTQYRREIHEHKEVEQVSAPTDANASKSKKGKAGKEKDNAIDWDRLRREAQPNGHKKERTASTRDSLDWEAVVHADASEIAEVIKERGMNNVLAKRIKELLDRLVKDHGSIDMEWLRDIPPDKAKEYLLSFNGLGLKSVECVRLLTLHHLAFPVDTNVARIAVRLGWVPLQPLPESLQLHLLEMYPIMESIQKYLWPRLCKLDQKTLYELHYHLITFGKVFCTKRQPNCNACPLRAECRHFASAFASARFALPATEEKSIVPSGVSSSTHSSSQANSNFLPLPPAFSSQHSQINPQCVNTVPTIEVPPSPIDLPLQETISHLERQSKTTCSEPIVEVPPSPEPEPEQEQEQGIYDIEDTFYEDSDEIPTIRLNMEELSQTLQNYINSGESNALVALTPEAASIPTPKLKNISRLRTEHHVYELPDTHPLLDGMDKREPDDPCPYLLAIWTPGETPDSIQPPERRCNSEDPNLLCNEVTCSYCNSLREANSQIVRGTLLIPCRTANRGSFPLNGTYFQVNEVFADHDSSLSPIAVPRCWLWNLPRRTVYFGTSIPTIFRGMRTEDIQHCFWRGFVCVRGFDQKRRVPRPLMARLHFVASRTQKGEKAKVYDE